MNTILILGSESDKDHANKITEQLDALGIPFEVVVASAHKVPEKVIDLLKKNDEVKDVVYITIAGRSNALSGVVSANSVHPVLACPPFKDKDDYMVNIHSTLQMPSETPVLTVLDPKNCALCVARIFGLVDENMQKKLKNRRKEIKAKF
jgi:5-(carboxyamino)imidazole ribonucleotide mutase